jgi:hypothetical protein
MTKLHLKNHIPLIQGHNPTSMLFEEEAKALE